MKRHLLCGGIALVALCASCSKETITTPKSTLVGTWQTTQWAADANSNDVLDASELQTDTDTRFTFNSNGTGTSWNGIHGSGDQDFNWMLSDNDLYLTLPGALSTIVDTYRVDALTVTDLTLAVRVRNTTALWWVFKKQ